MKRIPILLVFVFSLLTVIAQTHTDQNGIKTSVVSGLSAPGEQAKRYQVASIGYNSYHWQKGGLVIIELFNEFYETGYDKYILENGFGQGANSGNPKLTLAESHGINHSARVYLGQPIDLATNYNGYVNKSLPVYVDVKYYASYKVKITYMQDRVDEIAGINQLKVYENPTGESIEAFTNGTSEIVSHPELYLNSGTDSNHLYWQGHNLFVGTRPGDYSHNNFHIIPGGSTQGPLQSTLALWNTYSPTSSEKMVNISSSGNTFFNGGNVGIGTESPVSKLDIKDNGQHLTFITNKRLDGSWPPADEPKTMTIQSSGADVGRIAFAVGNDEAMRIDANRNVGIGTTNPQAKLDVGSFLDGGQTGTVLGRLVEGNYNGNGTFLGVVGYGTQSSSFNGKSFSIEHHFYGQTNSSINFYRGGAQIGGFITFNTDNNIERMRINPNGNISIGTTESDPTGALLTVKGSIHAKEVIVDINAPLADYVFKPGYKLMPLHQVEQYVNNNSHLPDVPSADEVKEKGMNMAEMQNKLLQKIEELTLYVIQQQKQIENQQKEIQDLKNHSTK